MRKYIFPQNNARLENFFLNMITQSVWRTVKINWYFELPDGFFNNSWSINIFQTHLLRKMWVIFKMEQNYYSKILFCYGRRRHRHKHKLTILRYFGILFFIKYKRKAYTFLCKIMFKRLNRNSITASASTRQEKKERSFKK